MTAEQIHDALTLLPADLTAETDRLRTGKATVILWKKYISLAACLVLVVSSSLYALALISRDGFAGASKGAPTESAAPQAPQAAPAEAPAADAPEYSIQNAPAEAAPEENCGTPLAPATDAAAGSVAHGHAPAEAGLRSDEPQAWCGNTQAWLHTEDGTITLSGEEAIALTRLLEELTFESDTLCQCPAEFTAETETAAGTAVYEINLSKFFVRLSGSQAALTREQADTLRTILEN